MLISSEKMYKAADYLRLSKEDGDFSFSGKKAESDSISSQRKIIQRFVAQQPDIELVAEYTDDGYTGTNFERPQFQKMMEAVKAGKINCIIVKDLSRFGREYIDAGRYIEKIFPQLGVRFIAVNDHYDSLNFSTSDSLIVPIKNFLNDSYCRDISIKVRSNFESRRRNGEFVSNYTPYGYLRAPDNKTQLVIDEVAGEVVRDIFRWKVEGMSPVTMAEKLNARGVLPPSEHKRSLGIHFKTAFQTNARSKWSPKTVIRILTNEVYTGVLIQGKRTTPNYKVKHVIIKDEQDWSRVEHAHEPIIQVREFELVQKLMQEDSRRTSGSDTVYPLSGRVCCGTCGTLAKRHSVTYNGSKYAYYTCPNAKKGGSCEKRRISERELESTVLAILQSEIQLILNMEQALNQIEELAWEHRETARLDQAMEVKMAEMERCRRMKVSIYEDLQDGLISQEEFLQMKEGYSQQISVIEQDIGRLKKERAMIQDGMANRSGWLSQFRKYQNLPSLSRSAVVNLVDKIELYPDKKIRVVLRYQDQLANMVEFLREQDAAKSVSEAEVG